jgi:hypothetical protein
MRITDRLMKPGVLGLLRAAKYLAREKVAIHKRVVEKLASNHIEVQQPLNDYLLPVQRAVADRERFESRVVERRYGRVHA